jgi:Zn-dependent protease
MNQEPPPLPPTSFERSEPPKPTGWRRITKLLGPVGVVLLFLGKTVAKLKFVLVPVVKFGLPVLKTGGTMALSIGFYALSWGWRFALGFVVLLFVHECGHLIVARQLGLNVGAPVFIPFMGAFIALKEAPRNAWIEACVGIGGPLLGTLAAALCEGLFRLTGNPLYRALAYTGFLLNLFNLAPIGFLDGGRVATALSPWLWLFGLAIMIALVVAHPNFLLVLILVLSLPRVFSLFRRRTEEERRYFEVTPGQRATMALLYFGLVLLLVLGMRLTHIAPHPPA